MLPCSFLHSQNPSVGAGHTQTLPGWILHFCSRLLELELLLGKKIPESHEEQERVKPKSSRGRRGRGGDQTTVVQFAPSILQTPSPVGRKKKKQILEVRYRAEKRVEGMWFLVGGGVWQAQAVRNPGTVARTAEPKCPPNARAPMEVHFVPDPHQGAQHALAWD